jgi:hypothetical protein
MTLPCVRSVQPLLASLGPRDALAGRLDASMHGVGLKAALALNSQWLNMFWNEFFNVQTKLVICDLALPKCHRMQSMEIELLSLEKGLLLITVEAMCVAELWCMHMGLQERAIHSSFPKTRILRPFFGWDEQLRTGGGSGCLRCSRPPPRCPMLLGVGSVDASSLVSGIYV